MELPFQVGRKLLCDFLLGDYSNKSISKNRLDELDNFDSLNWGRAKVMGEIDRLIANGMIEMVQSDYNRFVKVLSLTIRGRNEIVRPTLEAKRLGNRVDFGESVVSDEDRVRFDEFGDFLEMYNEEQKKAIISEARNLLCVAGAGSGKTTVLTKRIEFLVKHRGVVPGKILAITFTRKARLEMEKRLKELGIRGVAVHTFNSFCERILQRHGMEIYGRSVRVQGYGDKVLAMNMAVAAMGLDMDAVVDEYFNAGQKKFKTRAQLINAFMNDCFAVMDYFKVSQLDSKHRAGQAGNDYDWSRDVDVKDRVNAERIRRITRYLKEHMETQGLRDYSDQIIDAVNFLKGNVDKVPKFEHVLVDEYQDVNAMQIELLGLLKPENLFAVGDPRQSIFGWRGSDVNYILNFEKDFALREDADGRKPMAVEVVHLKKNYRSAGGVVEFMNYAIREMGLPDLEGVKEGEAKIRIEDFASEDAERAYVLEEIEKGDVGLNDTFVLARTNKILLELSRVMKEKGISHVVRSDESNGKVSEDREGVTLATVHAIKGLEAKRVFVIGANESNFPCKATDHPAVEMVKRDDYDREEEERRLFYVAVSRAREELIITYTKNQTYYISDEMRILAGGQDIGNEEKNIDEGLLGELKSWRSAVSGELGVAAFVIMSNKTLEEIAEKRPGSAEELVKINGIGPEKLMKWGKRILEIVGEFDDEE